LNNRHKATGEVFEGAIGVMTTLNEAAADQAVTAGAQAAADVTGFGLLGHLYKMMRASGLVLCWIKLRYRLLMVPQRRCVMAMFPAARAETWIGCHPGSKQITVSPRMTCCC